MIPTEFRRSQLIPVVYGTFGRVVMSSVATMLTSLIPTVFSPCSNMLNYSEMVWNTGAVGYLTHDVNFVSSSYGNENRRTRIGVVVCVLSSLLALSTATTTLVSAVPTEFKMSKIIGG
mgnify:FL=1